MRRFNLLLILALTFFTACNSSQSSSHQSLKSEVKVCPKCNMEIDKSLLHSATLTKNGTIYYFDDIGCMVLWSRENGIDTSTAKVFSNDTHRYIDAVIANYKVGEKTPMSYGFCAYENSIDKPINLDIVTIKMLRGEHMANPKIRKQILGY